MKDSISIKNQRMSIRIVFFIILIILILSLLLIFLIRSVFRVEPFGDSEKYLVNFPAILGINKWSFEPEFKDRADEIGMGGPVVENVIRITRNLQEPLAFISQSVATYSDSAAASVRYDALEQKLFISNKKTDDMDNFHSLQIIELHANSYKLSCTSITTIDTKLSNTQCQGLFHYNQFIVYLNVYPVRNSQNYLSDEELTKIIQAVDKMMLPQ